MRYGPLVAGSLTALLAALPADAGQILKIWEEGTRKGKPYQESITIRSSAEGLRLDSSETGESGKAESFSLLYRADEDTIRPIEPPVGPVISAATLTSARARADASGHRRPPGRFTVAPLHTTHTVGKWTCTGWALKRPGQSTEILYLADPRDVGLDETTRRNLRKMGDLLIPFFNAIKLAKGDDLRESFNTYGLEQGFPVREVRAKGGVVESDSQLVSIENADFPADLFKPPALPAGREAKPTPDRSISAEAYIARGLPAPDRSWTGDEYSRAAEVLQAIAGEDPARLPRHESEKSGDVFRRFVDPENLGLTKATTLDRRQRLQIGGGVAIGVAKVLNVYAGAAQRGSRFDAELAELMAFTLLVSRHVLTQAEEFFASLPADDPERPARLEARRKMRDGFATVVSGSLESLGEAEGLSVPARLRLSRALEEHVPALVRFLPAGAQQELPIRIGRMREAEKDPAVKESLERLGAALEKGKRRTAA